MNIVIRKARPEDLPAIQDLNYKLFLYDKDRDPDLNFEWPYQNEGKDYFLKRINENPGICFVAESSNKIVGYAAGRVNEAIDSTETVLRSELENIYVDEEARSRGAGKMLVQNLAEWAKSMNAHSMVVTAYAGNSGAIKFYEESGFSPFATKLEMKLNTRNP